MRLTLCNVVSWLPSSSVILLDRLDLINERSAIFNEYKWSRIGNNTAVNARELRLQATSKPRVSLSLISVFPFHASSDQLMGKLPLDIEDIGQLSVEDLRQQVDVCVKQVRSCRLWQLLVLRLLAGTIQMVYRHDHLTMGTRVSWAGYLNVSLI